MKITLFVLGCITLAMASCASPEERAARKAETTETAAPVTAAPDTTATATDTTATATSIAPAAPAATAEPATATTPAATEKPAATAATPATAAKATAAPAQAENTTKGKALLAKSDCLACHSITQKLVGPAYENVAAKYPATDENINHLVDKVIAGGQGVWGTVPMSPHPSLSKDDAKEMIKYILSLKK